MEIRKMNIGQVIAQERLGEIVGIGTIGIDIGSRQSKAVLIWGNQVFTALVASGVDSQETAEKLIDKLLRTAGMNPEDLTGAIVTGYGRIAIEFRDLPSEVITEITCHALGAHFINSGTRTIIDIGGQDCKAIKIDPADGHVIEFVMNDKCAAGTGRFLEKTAEMLGYPLEELGKYALESQKKLEISSQCVVFAESEIISLKARGERREDIAAGIHFATARRVRNMVNRIGLDPELIFTGGVSNNPGMKHALEELLKHPIKTIDFDMVYNGALGAAVLAQKVYGDRLLPDRGKEGTA